MINSFMNPYFEKCTKLKEYFIENKFDFKGNWKKIFPKNSKLFLDIGCGSGYFTLNLAKRHPDYNFIGIDYSIKFLYKAIKKVSLENLSNVKFICHNARKMDEIFSQNEIDGAYFLFSDPYNKNKQKKHRVFDKTFLNTLSKIIKKSRYLIIKTDENEYFKNICEDLKNNPNFTIISETNDFWNSEYCLADIKSHYEIKFSHKKINWLIAKNKN